MKSSGRNYALLIAFLSSFLTPFVGSSINVALPAIGQEFGANAILLGWIPTIYILSLAVFLVPFGRIADIYGRKKIFSYGVIIFTISSFVAIFSFSMEILLIFRVIQGIGAAMIFGTMAAIVASIFPPGVRGKALGITMTGVFLGLFLGPVLGGFLTEYFTWRSLFLFNVPLGIIISLGILKIKEEWKEAMGESFDFVGTILLGISLVILMYGLSILPELGGLVLLFVGLVGLFIFYTFEKRTDSPVMNIELFRNRIFAMNNVAAFINYSAGVSIVFILSLYLQYIYRMDPRGAGLILSVQPILMVVFSPVAGKLSDEVHPASVATVGMILSSVALFILSSLSKGSSLLLVVLALGVMGVGFAFFSSPNTNLIMSNVEEKSYGLASATISTMRVLGQMVGMGIVLFTLAVFLGSSNMVSAHPEEFLMSLKLSFMLFGCFSLIGAYVSWKSRFLTRS